MINGPAAALCVTTCLPFPVTGDARRPYRRCLRCRLIFVPPAHCLPPQAEKAHHDLHDNHPADPAYCVFPSCLPGPVRERLSPPARSPDSGGGPGSTLSGMLAEAGYAMTTYDPFHAPDPPAPEKAYDFISASEVAEHLYAPVTYSPRAFG